MNWNIFSLLIVFPVLILGCNGDFEEQSNIPQEIIKHVAPDTGPGWGSGYSGSIDGAYVIAVADSKAGGTNILLLKRKQPAFST